MATPRHQGSRKAESSTNYYALLLVKILLVLIILLWLPSLVDGRSRTARGSKRRKKNASAQVYHKRLVCEADCIDLYPEEAMNCILECVSPSCYSQIYDTPLEPGEIDLDKAGRLQTCAKQEVIEERRKQREKK
eukprot:scaffold1725_cov69-Cylindrotheca_fusiformis.AAC.1